MKLNPLKSAFPKSVSGSGDLPKPSPIRKQYKPSVRRELVAGGDIKWKPIDRAAAMMTAKAHWLCLPPPETKKENNMSTMDKAIDKLRHKETAVAVFETPTKSLLSESEAIKVLQDPKSACNKESALNADIANKFILETEKSLSQTQDLFNRAIDARNAMEAMCDSWKSAWCEFMLTNGQRLQDLRMNRIASETEIRQMMAGFRDVRQFFLDKDYQEERVRLKEFVELCERLKVLKESGFLDTVSDTMLNLSLGKRRDS
jgi:hypothetical protein